MTILEVKSRINEEDNKEGEDLAVPPSLLERGRSRSEDYNHPTATIQLNTGSIELTQEFLYNSGIELAPKRTDLLLDLEKELAVNARRLRLNEERQRLTRVDRLMEFL